MGGLTGVIPACIDRECAMMMDKQDIDVHQRRVLSVLRLLAPAATIAGTLCMYYGLESLLRNPQAAAANRADREILACWITGGFALLAGGLLATGAAYLGPMLAGGAKRLGPIESAPVNLGDGPIYDPSSPAEVLARITTMASPESIAAGPVAQADRRGFSESDWEAEDEFTRAAAEAYGRVLNSPTRIGPEASASEAPAAPDAPAGAAGPASQAPDSICCDRCHSYNAPGTRFCRHCGALLFEPVACPACGDFNDKGTRVCSSCGKELV